jgi:hypothetical protein
MARGEDMLVATVFGGKMHAVRGEQQVLRFAQDDNS